MPDNRRKVPNIRLVDGEKIDNLPDDTQGDITQVQSNLTSHEANTSNPHSVTKTQVGLGFVTNSGSPTRALYEDGVYRVPMGEGDVTLNDVQDLTNKTITDYTNTVYARALTFHIKATSTINKGQPIRVTGYNSGEDAFEVALANQTTGVANGVALQNLTIGQFGLMLSDGIIEGINTSSFTEGTILYLDGTGAFQATVPATGYIQQLAYVLRSHAVNGALQIKAQSPLQRVADIPGLQTTLDGKANLSGGNTFSGTQNVDAGELYIKESGIPTLRLKTTQPGTREWRISSAYNDWDSISIVDVTASNTQRLILGNDLIINGQNWTSAWTSYTPALINSTGATATITNAKLIPVGKIVHINIRLVITSKGTSSGDFGISMPVTSISDIVLSGGLFPINTKDSRGFPVTTGSQIKFTKQSQAALVSWADVSVNDELTVSGIFEIA